MKFLKVLGWIFVPWIMIFFQWKKIGTVGKTFGTIWAVIALLSGISNMTHSKPDTQDAKTTAATTTTDKQSTDTKNNTPTKEAPKAEKPKEQPKQEQPAQLSNTGVSSNVQITVEGMDTKDQVGDPDMGPTKAQGVFKIVKLKISNNQKDAITCDTNSFKLVDSQGREFSASSEAQTALAMANGGNDLGFFLKQINPGITIEGVVPFDIPKDATGLVLKAHGGMMGDEITLKVQ